MASAKVALVLDRDCGENLTELASRMAVWVIDSPSNKTVASELWDRDPNPEHMITTFTESRAVDETCFEGLMDNIELHHGEYSQTPPFRELEVFGLTPTPIIENVLADIGFVFADKTPTGFRALRSLETQLEGRN
jgi:hypothetical protein